MVSERSIIDISPRISPRLGVWPGDTPVSREVLCEIERGDTVTLSTLRGTVHLGAHADAPNHYGAGAPSIEASELVPYLGECRVVEARADRGQRVGLDQLVDLPRPLDVPRVLIRTGTFPDPESWNEDFAALEPELVDALADEGVRLIGIDTPSVDLQDSKELPTHARFLARDVAILEGLVLSHVMPGRFELIALPLALEGFDASPVRAVLRSVRDDSELRT